ncbi:hypothetical protein MY1884_005238 [Beauveria asiatica]
MMPAQWSPDLEQSGQAETFMQDIPSFWSLPYEDASVADAADIHLLFVTVTALTFCSYLQFIFQNLPIVSVAKLEDEQEFIRSTSPGVLAGMFALALPFTSWDEQLCLDSAYSKPDASKLWQISYSCLHKELHFPSPFTIQMCLLLLNTTTFDPVAVETPFAWSLACSVLAIAQSLGLHVEPSRCKIPQDEIRLRRRLWWAVTHGRSTMLREDDCNVAPISYADFAGSDNPSNTADYFISFCLLTNLANEICRSFL